MPLTGNLPHWAPGLGHSVEQVDGRWFVETSMGRVGFAFAPRNEYGILDPVTLPSGEIIYNPMRVIRAGNGSEVVFTLRRLPNMSYDDFARDAATVAARSCAAQGVARAPHLGRFLAGAAGWASSTARARNSDCSLSFTSRQQSSGRSPTASARSRRRRDRASGRARRVACRAPAWRSAPPGVRHSAARSCRHAW